MKKLIRSIIGGCLFIGGEYLGYRVFTNYNQNIFIHLFGVLAFCMTFGGVALLVEFPFSYLNKKYNEKKATNKTIAYLICVPTFVLIISSLFIPAFVFYHYTGKYHRDQIDKFGVVQKIMIESESHGKNSNNYSYFRFYHNGQVWKGDLPIWRYGIGDSAKIIYSKENPNEVEWYEKYLESRK